MISVSCMLTWTEDHRVPDHQVVSTWCARDPAWRVGGETLKVANETALRRSRLYRVHRTMISHSFGYTLPPHLPKHSMRLLTILHYCK